MSRKWKWCWFVVVFEGGKCIVVVFSAEYWERDNVFRGQWLSRACAFGVFELNSWFSLPHVSNWRNNGMDRPEREFFHRKSFTSFIKWPFLIGGIRKVRAVKAWYFISRRIALDRVSRKLNASSFQTLFFLFKFKLSLFFFYFLSVFRRNYRSMFGYLNIWLL